MIKFLNEMKGDEKIVAGFWNSGHTLENTVKKAAKRYPGIPTAYIEQKWEEFESNYDCASIPSYFVPRHYDQPNPHWLEWHGVSEDEYREAAKRAVKEFRKTGIWRGWRAGLTNKAYVVKSRTNRVAP